MNNLLFLTLSFLSKCNLFQKLGKIERSGKGFGCGD